MSPQIKPDVETFARVKVIGVGGSGLNAVDHMIRCKVKGVDFIGINTDAQDLHHSLMSKKLHIGRNTTRGLGAGMDPDLGRQAAEENKSEIQDLVKGADIVFITCGFGGGTGTGAGPVVAGIAKEAGILTIAVITKPFAFEGAKRSQIAEEGILKLKDNVDAMIVIPNERLLALVDKNTPFLSAFAMCDDVLRQAVQGISDLITTPGIINVDFSDVRAIVSNSGSALMGIGRASGEKRAEDAARQAINSPLLDMSIDGARGVLFAVAGGDDMTMWEIQEAARIITEAIDPEAKIIFGAFRDERLKKNELQLTVIASGFPSEGRIRKLFQNDKNGPNQGLNNKKENSPEEDWEAVPAFLRRAKK
ncbi:MAG: cell division protein FtsZ [Patescibacteria group bacterium]